jgi:hypothetical protein
MDATFHGGSNDTIGGRAGLPAGLVQGRFSENRPFRKKFGLGKLPAL